jgi:ribosome modulation factor
MPVKSNLQRALERAYKAGYQAGAGEQNAFLAHLQTTNRQLWQELLELDRVTPCNGVLLSRPLALKLYQALPSKNLGVAIQLKKQIRELDRHLDRILEILESCQAEK